MRGEKTRTELTCFLRCVTFLFDYFFKSDILLFPFFKTSLNYKMKQIIQIEWSSRVAKGKLVVLYLYLNLDPSFKAMRWILCILHQLPNDPLDCTCQFIFKLCPSVNHLRRLFILVRSRQLLTDNWLHKWVYFFIVNPLFTQASNYATAIHFCFYKELRY